MENTIIDLSHPINPAMPPWPGDPATEVHFLDQIAEDGCKELHCNVSRFTMNIHCGTHMDAPFHFFKAGRTIGHVPLERTYGLATLADLGRKEPGSQIVRADLEPFETSFRSTRKAILSTGWSRNWLEPNYFKEAPAITTEAAQFLVDCGVELVGVDMASVDHYPHKTHLVLLGNDLLIVENLTNLYLIQRPEFLFAAVPLNFEDRDGSPVRAVAIIN